MHPLGFFINVSASLSSPWMAISPLKQDTFSGLKLGQPFIVEEMVPSENQIPRIVRRTSPPFFFV